MVVTWHLEFRVLSLRLEMASKGKRRTNEKSGDDESSVATSGSSDVAGGNVSAKNVATSGVGSSVSSVSARGAVRLSDISAMLTDVAEFK